MTPLDNLRRLVAGWRGQWRVDAHEGITLSHDGEEWPIGALDGDAVIMLVELLNAIRPAVDGATAEIERLTAELAAANTLIASYESPTCDHRHPCRCGSGGHPRRCERHPNAYDRHIVELNAIGKTEAEREAVEVRICTIADEAFGPFPVHGADEACTAIERGAFEQRARIATLESELAAARAVPPDVEAAIESTVDGAEEAGRCSALGHAYLITKAPFWTVPHLKAAIARAIADATASKSATVGIAAAIKSVERIESTSKALGYSADYMAAIDRVLSCLRAVAENGGPLASTVDGGAGKPATVGGLLATAPRRYLCENQTCRVVSVTCPHCGETTGPIVEVPDVR